VAFLHECGHLFVACWSGVKVEVFSVGVGPELFGFTEARHAMVARGDSEATFASSAIAKPRARPTGPAKASELGRPKSFRPAWNQALLDGRGRAAAARSRDILCTAERLNLDRPAPSGRPRREPRWNDGEILCRARLACNYQGSLPLIKARRPLSGCAGFIQVTDRAAEISFSGRLP
jgi:hypothetical protein